ncbi:MAG: TIR domain-containing protein [Proteobacteria bacterium]|nr:TIR domain-containing protein [Pseudomonadota bacterium]
MESASETSKPQPAGTVFLSYASEDAPHAEKIARALRNSGIEVWFDKSELRGGDAWDRLIRRQIHDCRLFVALISTHTNERDEGYFRREWKLAVDRTHDMAEDVPFLLPVVVDGAAEATARVPDRFREIQWTHLDENRLDLLVSRIQRLLTARTVPAKERVPPRQSPASAAAPALRRTYVATLLALLVVAASYGVYRWQYLPGGLTDRTLGQAEDAANAAPSAAPAHSVAVLPFVNMSGDPSQEYFSDGLTEELIDVLIRSTDLRVPASTSSFYFKGKQVTIAQIAAALSVSYVLEGSVRKAGDTLRVTAQLVRARDGYHVWSNSYDRRTGDLFAVQDDIAAAVVAALKVHLSGTATLAARRTANPEAHDQYLIGKKFLESASVRNYQSAADAFTRALQLDPTYAAAKVGLADAHYMSTAGSFQMTPDRFSATLREINEAIAMAPDLPDGYSTRGVDTLETPGDLAKAAGDLRRALELEPENSINLRRYGFLLMCSGDLAGATRYAKASIAADPLDVFALAHLGYTYLATGEVGEARSSLEKALEVSPDSDYALAGLATAILLQHDYAGLLNWLDAHPAFNEAMLFRSMAQFSLGDAEGSRRSLASYLRNTPHPDRYGSAQAYAWRGEYAKAIDSLREESEHERGGIACSGADPLMTRLREQPAFRTFLRDQGLAR